MIELDSHSTKSPSTKVGTRPLGFIARYSASLLRPNCMPASIRSWAMSSSARHQSTFCTFTEFGRPQIVNPTFSAPQNFLERHTGNRESARAKKTPPAAGPDLRSNTEIRSVAEEQPQQNDHRDRHAQKPKQNSSSHRSLLNSSCSRRQRRGEWMVPCLIYQCPVFGIDDHGSAGALGSPFCNS